MGSTFSLLIFFALVTGVSLVIVGLSALVGRRELSEESRIPYECGLDPRGTSRKKFSIKFFLVAALFVVFDAEVLFLFPSAIVYKEMIFQGAGLFMFVELAIFIFIIAMGLLYCWKARALEWEE